MWHIPRETSYTKLHEIIMMLKLRLFSEGHCMGSVKFYCYCCWMWKNNWGNQRSILLACNFGKARSWRCTPNKFLNNCKTPNGQLSNLTCPPEILVKYISCVSACTSKYIFCMCFLKRICYFATLFCLNCVDSRYFCALHTPWCTPHMISASGNDFYVLFWSIFRLLYLGLDIKVFIISLPNHYAT